MSEDKGEMTVREAAKLLGVRLEAVYGLVWTERIAARKHEGRWLILREAVQERVAKHAAEHKMAA